MGRENFTSSRRAFLGASLTAALGLLVDEVSSVALYSGLYGREPVDCPPGPLRGGVRIGTVGLDGLEAPPVPLHKTVGSGLDARLFTDLSTLTPDTLITPNERFFIRTTRPRAARDTARWKIEVGGLVDRPFALSIDEVAATAKAVGTHLIECAGNARGGRFGLISAAAWTGVPFANILDRAAPAAGASHVAVIGVDDAAASATSVPGASWVFPVQQLTEAGAFLATGMNGHPLPADHGAPVRLVVPGWYGCACIKWVNALAFVDDREAATDQMKEFASRTHQRGMPALARDYEPATIDFAAMPVRVERWRVDARTLYNIVGVAWGGDAPAPSLMIRFNPRERFVAVNGCPPLPPAPLRGTWALWNHVWEPAEPGRYQIVLKAADPRVRTRRLDLYFYTRTVRIDQV